MAWSPDRNALRGRVAVIAGATRGAGRGIAAALGEAGATVVCTGRTTGSTRSEYNRAETIEEPAGLVTQLGGTGIAVAVDHLDHVRVNALAQKIRADHGRVDVLVNNIWGGELLKGGPAQWNTPIWKLDLDKGLRILRLTRLALSQGHELQPHGAAAVAITPGWLRSEMMLDNFGVREENWRDAVAPARAGGGPSAPPDFALSESPRYVGRAVAALAADPDRARWNQQSVSSGQLAREYGFTDLDGSRPDIWRYIEEVRERGLLANPDDYR
jgi:NAD(P)-dependent dehydrogenase (short-subunit alcohol dehydrogenase family)